MGKIIVREHMHTPSWITSEHSSVSVHFVHVVGKDSYHRYTWPCDIRLVTTDNMQISQKYYILRNLQKDCAVPCCPESFMANGVVDRKLASYSQIAI